jgi:hypothetical protein
MPVNLVISANHSALGESIVNKPDDNRAPLNWTIPRAAVLNVRFAVPVAVPSLLLFVLPKFTIE